jgi:hypothetical protein
VPEPLRRTIPSLLASWGTSSGGDVRCR